MHIRSTIIYHFVFGHIRIPSNASHDPSITHDAQLTKRRWAITDIDLDRCEPLSEVTRRRIHRIAVRFERDQSTISI
jgi:hypothetical protein